MKKYFIAEALAIESGHLILPNEEIYAESSPSGNFYYIYSIRLQKKLGSIQKAKFEATIKQPEVSDVPEFPNGFRKWVETLMEMNSYITLAASKSGKSNSVVLLVRESEGGAGMYDLALEWAKEFELINKDREWDGEFYEEVEIFAQSKDLGLSFRDHLEAYYAGQLKEAEEASKELVVIYPAFEGKRIDVTKAQLNLLLIQKLISVKDTGYWYLPENIIAINKIVK